MKQIKNMNELFRIIPNNTTLIRLKRINNIDSSSCEDYIKTAESVSYAESLVIDTVGVDNTHRIFPSSFSLKMVTMSNPLGLVAIEMQDGKKCFEKLIVRNIPMSGDTTVYYHKTRGREFLFQTYERCDGTICVMAYLIIR